MQQKSFKFLINDRVFSLSPFKRLTDISINIQEELFFSDKHQYYVQSKVSTNVFMNFLDYLTTGKVPTIEINTFNEYQSLSIEFETLSSEIENKKNEYGEFLINLNGLKNSNSEDKAKYEEQIALKLDEYVKNYGLELMNNSIEALYSIFNHPSRKLTLFDDTYEIIKNHFEKTNDSNIFILLDLLDGTKMTRKNIEESFALFEERFNHMPKIDFTTLSNYFKQLKTQEERLSKIEESEIDLNANYESLLKQQKENLEKQINLEQKHLTDIQNLENKINEFKQISISNTEKQLFEQQSIFLKTISEQKEQISMLEEKSKNEEMKNKISNLENKINELKQISINNTEKHLNELDKKIKQLFDQQSIFLKTISEQKEQISMLEEKSKNEEMKNKMNNLEKQIEEQKSKIKILEEQLKNSSTTSNDLNTCQPFTAEISKNSPGILYRLKKNAKSPFHHLFITSLSSNDIYNVINPETNDDFDIVNFGNFIELEFESTYTVTGIKLYSSSCYFPKTFDIEINDQVIRSFKEINEFTENNREMKINFDSIQCQRIRLINRGTDNIRITKIELMSSETRYSRGIFSTLVYQNKNHDPHRLPVRILASRFDSDSIQLIDTKKYICTGNLKNSWFQIEFPYGKAILSGFRLKRQDPNRMKNFKIICTDDACKPEEKWITLIKIEEKSKEEHQLLDIYEFPQPSSPISFIKLIQTGPNWDDSNFLLFYHFELFGSYS